MANWGLPAVGIQGLSVPEMTALMENGAESAKIKVLASHASSIARNSSSVMTFTPNS